jgi:hypothetical protein
MQNIGRGRGKIHGEHKHTQHSILSAARLFQLLFRWFYHPFGPDGPSVILEFTPYRIEVVCNERGISPKWRPAILVRSAAGGWEVVDAAGTEASMDNSKD